MGLAASQGRFLLLTARQSDVELRMQSITNQKLALMRESSQLSKKYADASNAQNVMWQPNSDADAVELSYGNMMYEGSPYVLTNAYGAVMLDSSSSIAKSLSSKGINLDAYPNGMSGDQFVQEAGSKEEFLRKFVGDTLKVQAVLDAEEANDLKDTGEGQSTFETAYDDATILNKAFNVTGEDGEYTDFAAYNDGELLLDVSDSLSGSGTLDYAFKEWGWNDDSKDSFIDNDSNLKSDNNFKTREDALAAINSNDSIASITSSVKDTIYKACSSLQGALVEELCTNGPLGEFTSEINEACAWAETATLNKFLTDTNDQDSTDSENEVEGGVRINNIETIKVDDVDNASSETSEKLAGTNSNDLTMVYTYSHSAEFGNDPVAYTANVKIDIQQVAATFLNYFDLYCEQHFSANNDVNTTDSSLGSNGNVVDDDTSYRGYSYYDAETGKTTRIGGTSGTNTCTINGKAVGVSSGLDSTAVYWLEMYNQMAKNGIQFNDNLSDKDYVQQQMIYGNLSLQKFNSYDDTKKVSLSDDNSPMYLQDDEEAAEQAEKDYNAESDALEYKETLLDSMLQDLEAEREAITTEKDSVQKIIDNNIKKFKIFC